MIVGFPGETEEDFSELYDFIQRTKFDKLGAVFMEQGKILAIGSYDNGKIHVGEFVKCEIIDVRGYDLVGEIK